MSHKHITEIYLFWYSGHSFIIIVKKSTSSSLKSSFKSFRPRLKSNHKSQNLRLELPSLVHTHLASSMFVCFFSSTCFMAHNGTKINKHTRNGLSFEWMFLPLVHGRDWASLRSLLLRSVHAWLTSLTIAWWRFWGWSYLHINILKVHLIKGVLHVKKQNHQDWWHAKDWVWSLSFVPDCHHFGYQM